MQVFSKYEVHITTANDPNTSIIWNSGTVASGRTSAPPLSRQQPELLRVRSTVERRRLERLERDGNLFYRQHTYVPPNNGVVTISGRSFYDNNAHYLGLGATYMQALRHLQV
jgi:hypothetical protein